MAGNQEAFDRFPGVIFQRATQRRLRAPKPEGATDSSKLESHHVSEYFADCEGCKRLRRRAVGPSG